MTKTSVLASALAFARRGYAVFPIWWPRERDGRLICACRKGADAAGDLSTMPLHPADIATDTHQQDMSLYFMENENVQLQDIEDALERIHEDRFGRCEECEHEIALERLRAIPYAALCVDCQRRQEEAA
jgi:RNA polymerase-binding protein DksA